MTTALLSCPSCAETVAAQVRDLGWRPMLAPSDTPLETLAAGPSDVLLVELPTNGWRARIRSTRAFLARQPGVKALFLSRAFPDGYGDEAPDGDGAIPLVRIPCPTRVLHQSLAAAG